MSDIENEFSNAENSNVQFHPLIDENTTDTKSLPNS